MSLHALEFSIDVIRELREPLRRLSESDGDLARQLRRALSSVPLNLSEGGRRVGKDRKHFWRIAAGSAVEAHTALRVAVAWGYLQEKDIAPSLGRLDRILAMLWSMAK